MRHPTELHSGEFDWAGLRLLVFSLDDAFRFLVRSTFRKLNAKDVLSTSVPADAPALAKQMPDAVLVDFDLDAQQAFGFLERIRDSKLNPVPGVPVMAVVRREDQAHLVRARELGIEDVVPKPISGHELVLRVATMVKQPKRMAPERKVEKPHIVLSAPQPTPPPIVIPIPPGAVQIPPAPPAPTSPPYPASHPVGPSGPRSYETVGGGGGRDYETLRGKVSGGKIGGALEPENIVGAKQATRLSDDDLAPAASAKGGAKLSFDDMAFSSSGASKGGGKPADKLELLAQLAPPDLRPPQPKAEDEQARKAKAAWEESLAEAGHESRTGNDVAALDVTSIVAAHLEWLQSQGAQGKRAVFEGMDLAGADLARTVLAGAGFRRAELSDATLSEARLDGADMRFASMSAADCSGAVLGVAQLRHADMRLANLEGTSLRGADLSGARLGGARTAGADFNGATLVETDLREADLSKAENLRQAQIDKAITDHTTRLPPGLRVRRKEE